MSGFQFLSIIKSEIISNVTIRKFSGDTKVIYRLLIANFFCSSFTSDFERFNYAKGNLERLYFSLKNNNVHQLDKDELKDIKLNCTMYLHLRCKLNVMVFDKSLDENYVNEEQLNSSVVFFRKYAEDYTNSKKTLYRYSNVKEFWKIERFYEKPNTKLLPHHWIEIKPFNYPYPILTFPEYFAYQDLINLWNDTLAKHNETEELGFRYNDSKSRETRYSYFSSLRTCLTLGVHFIETYLYYLYYNMKSNPIFKNNAIIKRKDIRKITDKTIIEKLIFEEFPDLKSNLNSFYKKYKETLEFRDAFVHMSAFTEDKSDLSRMQRLININIDMITGYLQNGIDMIINIEEGIQENKILFWWDRVESPNFINKNHISPLMG